MTNVVFALPILGVFLLQTAEQRKQPREQAPAIDLSPSAPQAPSPSAPGEKPFRKLFEQTQDERAARQALQALTSQKPEQRIVCGMVVIQANPNIDPKFVVRAPPDTSAHKIRRIPPTACAD
jgi:hypothetical protein